MANYIDKIEYDGTDYLLKDTEVVAYGHITGEAPENTTIISDNNWHEVYSFTLPYGVWMVSFAVQFGYGATITQNSTGIRCISLGTSSGAMGTVIRTLRAKAAGDSTSNFATTLSLTVPVESTVDGDSKYYINALQTSGATLVAQPRYTAIKIGETVNLIS